VDKNLNLNVNRMDRLDISHLSDEELDVLEAALRKTHMLTIEGKREDDEGEPE
jgi:hypothetical protein